MAIEFGRPVPVLRMLDVARAEEFCLGLRGFKVGWDHRFDDGAQPWGTRDLLVHDPFGDVLLFTEPVDPARPIV